MKKLILATALKVKCDILINLFRPLIRLLFVQLTAVQLMGVNFMRGICRQMQKLLCGKKAKQKLQTMYKHSYDETMSESYIG